MDRLTIKGFEFDSHYVASSLQSFPIAEALKKLQSYEDAEEQQNDGCEYCRNDCVNTSNKILLHCNGSEVYINRTTLNLFENEHGDNKETKIGFCPMCGRKLN